MLTLVRNLEEGSRLKLKGIIPAIATPMKPDYSIDYASLKKYVRWLVEEGAHGLAVNADTGEGPHLWQEERIRVVETVKEEVGDRVPVIAGLSASFTQQAVGFAKDMKKAGADALLVFPLAAFRGRPQSAKMVLEYHRTVAEEGELPLIMFQLQDALGGVEFELETLTELAHIPGVIAIKEASFDANKYVRTVRHLRATAPELTILSGNDNFLAESLILGADGMLIGFGTLCTRLQVQMYEAAVRGDFTEVMRMGAIVQPLSDFIFSLPVRDYRARTKEALKQMDIIEHACVRPPLRELDDAEREKVKEWLKKVGQL